MFKSKRNVPFSKKGLNTESKLTKLPSTCMNLVHHKSNWKMIELRDEFQKCFGNTLLITQ